MAGVGDGGDEVVTVEAGEDGALVVRLNGELDLVSVERLGSGLDRLLEGDGRRVVIDATGLTFMDSCGIALLLKLAARAGGVDVLHASEIVEEIILASGTGEHLRVVSEAPRRSRRFPCTSASVRGARRFVVASLADAGPRAVRVLEVLVSELATNAVRHAHTDFDVVVTSSQGGVVRVEVADAGPGLPVVLEPRTTEPRGRGLKIVDSLADRWGVIEGPHGTKSVWVEVSTTSPPR